MKSPVKTSLSASIALAIATGLTGCGSGDTISAPPPTVSGVAVDGLLSGMFCYADINNNSVFDSGTDIAAENLTGPLGNYSITGDGADSATTICRAEDGAEDQATGEPFSGQLSAPAGSTVVSPVTTLIVALGGDANAEEAARSILGLDSTVNLKANPLQTPALAKAAAQIQAVVTAISNAISQQTGSTNKQQQNAIVAETFKALAQNAAGQTSPLTNSTVLANTINSATSAITGTSTNDAASSLADSMLSLLANIDTQYDPVIAKGAGFTVDELNSAQQSSISNSAINTAFTENGVSLSENSLSLSEGISIDSSETPADAAEKVLYSSAGNDNQDPETFSGEFPLTDFGNGASFDADVTTDSSFDRVFAVTSGEGYGADVHVAFAAFVNYTPGFTKGYNAFKAKVKGSPSNRIEVKFFGDASQESAVNIDLTTYEGATDIGNGWYDVTIPFSEFTNGSEANFDLHSGWLIGPPGDQADETFVFFFTDIAISLENLDSQETDNGTDEETDTGTDTGTGSEPLAAKTLYSGTSAESDDPETFVALDNFGSGAAFDANVTTDTSFDRVFSVTSGEGYGAGVH
ncbi:MAG: hypothetical protein JXK16_08485, partial [Thiotrichales bacterium]|nr:hypothetical protein [Thiotrichales bacterium]